MLKKGLIAGFANLAVGMGLNFGLQALIPPLAKEYQNTALFRSWSDPLMMVFFLHPFILGLVLAYFWNLAEKHFTGDAVKKAYQFARLYFIVATIPGMFISYTSFQISLQMTLSWTLVGFLEAFVAGLVFTKIK